MQAGNEKTKKRHARRQANKMPQKLPNSSKVDPWGIKGEKTRRHKSELFRRT